MVTSALEVVGIALLSVAAFLVAPALGLAVVGAGCIGLSWLLKRGGGK